MTLPFYTAAGYKKLAIPEEPASRRISLTRAQFEAAAERVDLIIKKGDASVVLAAALNTINKISDMSAPRKSNIKKHADN